MGKTPKTMSNSEDGEKVSPLTPDLDKMTDPERMFRKIASKQTKEARKAMVKRVFGEAADLEVDTEYARNVRDVVDKVFMNAWSMGCADYGEGLTKKLIERKTTRQIRRHLGI